MTFITSSREQPWGARLEKLAETLPKLSVQG
jgi:hypothetical protein